MVKTEAITKSYKDKYRVTPVLHEVSINFEKGKFNSIMGASGAGKSTILYIIGGLLKPDTGRVYIGDTEITKLNDKDLSDVRCKKIGFVFQFYNLIPFLSVKENVMLPLILANSKTKNYEKRISTLLETVGMKDKSNRKVIQLSGGEQQRVAIARALINEPEIILADEPTGNLDSKNARLVEDLLYKLCKEYNNTIIMVTHNDEALRVSDNVIYLKDGRVINK